MCNCKNELTLTEQAIVLSALMEKSIELYGTIGSIEKVGKDRSALVNKIMVELCEDFNTKDQEKIFNELHRRLVNQFIKKALKEGYC